MASKFSKRLKGAKKNWKKGRKRASDSPDGYESVDDGKYVARLKSAQVGESQSSGRLQIMWNWEILEGDFKGQTVLDFDGLETEDNLMWLARKLNKLGYEAPDDLEDIEDLLKELEGEMLTFRIKLKTKNEYQNLFIDKQVKDDDDDEDDDEDDSDEDESEAEEDDDDNEESDEDDEEDEEDDESDESDDEDEDEEDEEPELEKGMMVRFKHKKKKVEGKVLHIKGDVVSVKLQSGVKVKVDLEDVTILDLEDPPKKRKKKR